MNILAILALAALVCIAGYMFFRRAAKGPKRSMNQLKRSVEDLLRRGFDGGTLIIDHANSEKFVQFKKYILDKGNYGIKMDFPVADWTRDFLVPLKVYCEQNQLNIYEREGVFGKELSFLEIDFRKDSESAHASVEYIFEKIMGLGNAESYYVLLENAAVNDVLVDSNPRNGKK